MDEHVDPTNSAPETAWSASHTSMHEQTHIANVRNNGRLWRLARHIRHCKRVSKVSKHAAKQAAGLSGNIVRASPCGSARRCARLINGHLQGQWGIAHAHHLCTGMDANQIFLPIPDYKVQHNRAMHYGLKQARGAAEWESCVQ
jgi:hypothetical protein